MLINREVSKAFKTKVGVLSSTIIVNVFLENIVPEAFRYFLYSLLILPFSYIIAIWSFPTAVIANYVYNKIIVISRVMIENCELRHIVCDAARLDAMM